MAGYNRSVTTTSASPFSSLVEACPAIPYNNTSNRLLHSNHRQLDNCPAPAASLLHRNPANMLSSTLLLAAAAAGLGSNGVAAQSSTTSSVAAASPTTKLTTVVLVIDQTANNVLPLPFSRGLKEPYIPASAASQGPNGINLSTIPYFQVYNAELARSILSENTSVVELVREEGYAFAHEAITYFPQDDVSQSPLLFSKVYYLRLVLVPLLLLQRRRPKRPLESNDQQCHLHHLESNRRRGTCSEW